MLARSTGSTTRPNTLMQLSRSSVCQHHLATHGRTIHYGTTPTKAELPQEQIEADLYKATLRDRPWPAGDIPRRLQSGNQLP